MCIVSKLDKNHSNGGNVDIFYIAAGFNKLLPIDIFLPQFLHTQHLHQLVLIPNLKDNVLKVQEHGQNYFDDSSPTPFHEGVND